MIWRGDISPRSSPPAPVNTVIDLMEENVCTYSCVFLAKKFSFLFLRKFDFSVFAGAEAMLCPGGIVESAKIPISFVTVHRERAAVGSRSIDQQGIRTVPSVPRSPSSFHTLPPPGSFSTTTLSLTATTLSA